MRRLFFFLLLVVCARSYSVQDSCLKVSGSDWEKISKKDYTETFVDPEPEKMKKDFSDLKAPSMDLGGLKYVFYVIVVAAILFLVIKILQNINTTPVINPGVESYTLEQIEEKVLEIDLDKILADAIAARDFRLALRLNFLIIIKKLSLSGKIVWQKEKTNGEYLREIKDMMLSYNFRNIVLSFESIWYGEHTVNEEQYASLQSSYEQFKSSIQ
jgi:hypothetical protein